MNLPMIKSRPPHEQMDGLLKVWEQLGTDKPFPMPYGPTALWVGAWYDGCLGVFNDGKGGIIPSPYKAEDIPFSKEALLARLAEHLAAVDYAAIRDAEAPGFKGGTNFLKDHGISRAGMLKARKKV